MKFLRTLFAIGVIVTLLACGGAEERKAAYMAKAEQSLSVGDLDKARIDLKNVLQIDPKDAGAWFKLGTIFERKQEMKKAFKHYNKAAELEPENMEYQGKVGRFYLILGNDIDKATEKMELILAQNPDDVNGLLLKAGILLRQGNAADAKEISRDLFEDHPENLENAIFLSSMYSRDKEYAEAITVLEAALQSNPDDRTLLSVLGNALFINKDYERSEQIWQQLLDAHPEVFQNHLRLALFYQKTGETAKAEQVLRAAIAVDDKDMERKFALVEFLQGTAGPEQAMAELEQMIAKHPDEGKLRLALAQLQTSANDIDAAIASYKAAIEDFSKNETGITSRVQLARIYAQKQDMESAQSIIDEAEDIAPNDAEVNLMKAKIALFNQDTEQAIISLRTVIKDDPENIEGYLLLVQAHEANDETIQAEEVLARAYQNNRDNTKALMPLAKYHIRNKNVADAEQAIDDYLRLDANNYEALSIKASILNGRNEFDKAEPLADRMLKLYPEKENGYLQSAPVLISRRAFDKATELLHTGYQKTGSVQVIRLNAMIQVSAGRPEQAVAMLTSASEKDDSEQLQLLLANAHVANKDNEAAKKVIRDSIMTDKSRTNSYIALAAVYVGENDLPQAITALEEGVQANPNDTQLALNLAGYYEKAGDFDSAINQYEQILGYNPDNLLANNNLAALLVDHRDDEESLNRAKTIAEKLKIVDQPVILDTVGWVYYKTGDYSDATRVLEQVVAAQPEAALFNYHLGMAHYKAGNTADARKHLEAALASDEQFPGRDVAEATLNDL